MLAVAVLTPALRRLLLVGGGLMAVNSLYPLAVTLTERLSGALLKDEFVGWMSAAKSTEDAGGFRCAHPPYIHRVSVASASFLIDPLLASVVCCRLGRQDFDEQP